MPFCTNCGANVTGTFCSQCGAPAGAAAATPPAGAPAAAAPVPAANQYGQVVPLPPPAPRKTSPIVWVLVVLLGIFVLGGIAVVGVIGYVAHRVHQTVQVNGRDGGFAIHTRDASGKDATVEFGGTGKLPPWIPTYPGSEGKTSFAVRGVGDSGEGGSFYFTTRDDAGKVKSYYTDKFKDMGMKVTMETTTGDGGMIVAEDENERRSLTVILTGHGGETTVNVTYGRK